MLGAVAYEAIIRSMTDSVIVTDSAGTILYVNPAFTQESGYEPAEIVGRNILALQGGEADPGSLAAPWPSILSGNGWRGEVVFQRKDGSRPPADLSCAPMIDGNGAVIGMVGILRNATERERLRQSTIQVERLILAGRLLCGVAHELNNPLTSIIGYSDILAAKAHDDEEAANLQKIARSAQRAARLIRNLLTFIRAHRPQSSPVRINEVVRSVLELLEAETRAQGVRLALDLEPDDRFPETMGDFHRLQEVFLNLITNALHAMKEIDGPRVVSLATRCLTDHVEIRIRDTGPGISAENRPRLFDPFFTTKAVGEGTGLGLTIAREIIEDHGGTIRAESGPTGGAAFIISLPVIAPETAAERDRMPETVGRIGPNRILVVEDDPAVAEMLRAVLESQGHTAEIASNGLEAIEKLAAAPFDLVLSDVKMPGAGGEELLRWMSSERPELRRRTAFITGDILSPETRAFLDGSGCPHLTKPFGADEVIALLRSVTA